MYATDGVSARPRGPWVRAPIPRPFDTHVGVGPATSRRRRGVRPPPDWYAEPPAPDGVRGGSGRPTASGKPVAPCPTTMNCASRSRANSSSRRAGVPCSCSPLARTPARRRPRCRRRSRGRQSAFRRRDDAGSTTPRERPGGPGGRRRRPPGPRARRPSGRVLDGVLRGGRVIHGDDDRLRARRDNSRRPRIHARGGGFDGRSDGGSDLCRSSHFVSWCRLRCAGGRCRGLLLPVASTMPPAARGTIGRDTHSARTRYPPRRISSLSNRWH